MAHGVLFGVLIYIKKILLLLLCQFSNAILTIFKFFCISHVTLVVEAEESQERPIVMNNVELVVALVVSSLFNDFALLSFIN